MKGFTTILLVCFLAVLLTDASAVNVVDIAYVKGGGRSLIFVNNPEQIFPGDLGDGNYGDKTIMRTTGVTGAYRDYFEHLNRTGFTIGHGVQLYNPNATSVTVRINGSGYEASVNGGLPFKQMFSNYSSTGTSYIVPAGGSRWLMRNDNSVANNSFFSGVIDFVVSGGPVTINNIAYRSFASLDGSTAYMGYIQRVEPDGTHEARVYKGTSGYTEVTAGSLDFSISDGDGAGVLPVRYPNYNLTAGGYGSPVTRTGGWVSHIPPSNNANAITNDMLAFNMPGWGPLIDPVVKSDGEGKYPNLGNWGVVYVTSGTVTNNGSRTRSLSINLKANPTSSARIAYRGGDGIWRDLTIAAGANVQHYTFSVPAGGMTTFQSRFVLGGPSGANLTQSISLNN